MPDAQDLPPEDRPEHGEMFLFSDEDVEIIKNVHVAVHEMALVGYSRMDNEEPEDTWRAFKLFADLFALLFLGAPGSIDPDVVATRERNIRELLQLVAAYSDNPAQALMDPILSVDNPKDDGANTKSFEPPLRAIIDVEIDGCPKSVENPTPETIASAISEMLQSATWLPWWGFAKVHE